MAGELVKWNGGKLVRVSPPVADNRRVVEAALALLRPRGAQTRPPMGRAVAVASVSAGDPVDLPRICAVHDKPYAARYVMGADGRFRRGPMIEVTEPLYLRQYAGNAIRRRVPTSDIADETCPWCGASGFGAVLCTGCNFEICYGRTAGRFFRCRTSCGHAGNMAQLPRTHEGVTPCEAHGGSYAVPGGK